MSEEKEQRLKEFQNNYREDNKSKTYCFLIKQYINKKPISNDKVCLKGLT